MFETVGGETATVTTAQVDALREAAYTDRFADHLQQRNDALVTLLYDAGLGPGTLVSVDVGMLSPDRRELVLPPGLCSDPAATAPRRIDLDSSGRLGTRRLLASYLRSRWKDVDALFPSRKADRITPRGVRYVVEELAAAADVTPRGGGAGGQTDAAVTPAIISRSGRQRRREASADAPDSAARYGTAARSRVATSSGDATTADRRRDGSDVGEVGMPTDAVLDAIADPVYVLDRNARLGRWNESLSTVTGRGDGTLSGLHVLELFAPADRERVGEAVASAFDGGVTTWEADLLTADGDPMPHEFTGAPVTDADGAIRGVAGTGRDLTERTGRDRRLEWYRTAVNAVGDAVYHLDPSGDIVAVNDTVPEVTGYDREALLGTNVELLFDDEDVAASVAAIRDLLERKESATATVDLDVYTADGETIPAEARMSVLRDDGDLRGTVGVVRDVTERKERERELQRQRDELTTLNRINAVIRQIGRALVRARTREEIEQTVCDNLVDVDRYRFTWIGDHDVATGRVEPRAASGVEDGYLDDRPDADGAQDGVTAETAYRTGEVQVAQRVEENPAFAPWRAAALERGYRSAIAIPLSYRDATYGVLCVYADRPNAFDDRECRALSELGETIAHAISAVKRQRALVADTVVELEFVVADPDVFLADVSARADCELSLEGTVSRPDESLAAFATATGASADAVVEAAEEAGAEASVVSESAEGVVVRFVVDSLVTIDLAEHGGAVREVTAADGRAELAVEFPPSVDVRTVVEAIEERYPGADFRAKRERQRRGQTATEFRSALDERLTERQREVVQTAYLAGFFEWPRDSSGEEVASALGISTPTFHEHVRTGQRKLFDRYFELDG